LIDNLLIKNNFFPEPDLERAWALSLEYPYSNFSNNSANNRSMPIHAINENKFNHYKNLLYENFNITDYNYFNIIGCSFQFNNKNDYTEIHYDSDWDLAGVVYLTPNAPSNSGTAFYTKENDTFKKVYEVENVYNRAIIYPAWLYHEGQNFFGNVLNDSRLNLVFFAKTSY
jgi:hypothetical protein